MVKSAYWPVIWRCTKLNIVIAKKLRAAAIVQTLPARLAIPIIPPVAAKNSVT